MPSARFQGREFNRFRDEENIGLLKAKHPYFWGKTSELCLAEVRTFCFSDRKTAKKQAKQGRNSKRSNFAIFRDKKRRGGFRAPSRTNNSTP